MGEVYLITGANGHLGNTLIRLLARENKEVRGFLRTGEKPADIRGGDIKYYWGDIRNMADLEPFFEGTKGRGAVVIHTAGIVDISDTASELMMEVNVEGTRNILELCRRHAVSRLVHVSSVHAIPEKASCRVIDEVDQFSSEAVEGGYAKTKAIATKTVLEAAKAGLNAVVVHPSGILGPYDTSGNHLVQLVNDYLNGRLPAGVKGGYDFVDVRDVAKGCLAAAKKGRRGECYILSNRHYEIRDLFGMLRNIRGGRRLPTLPGWMVKAALPFVGWYAKRVKHRPLYTRYSLYTLSSNDRFSHDKASRELDYHPRDLYDTLRDTVLWADKDYSYISPS